MFFVWEAGGEEERRRFDEDEDDDEKAEIMIVNEVVLEVPVQDDIRQESDSNTNHPVDEILSSIAIFVIISFSFFKNTHRLIDLFLILASVWGNF